MEATTKESTMQLLEQIANPNYEQRVLIRHVRYLLEEPQTEANKQVIRECIGRIWMLVK